MVMGSGGSGKTSFQREKNFSRSPRAPLTLSRKAGKLFYLSLPTRVGNRAFVLSGVHFADFSADFCDFIPELHGIEHFDIARFPQHPAHHLVFDRRSQGDDK